MPGIGFANAASLVAIAALAGCAKKAPPAGGPPDIEAPRLVSTAPDSGAAKVRPDALLSLTFSEGMEPRSTNDAIAVAPPVEIRRYRWSGRTVSLEPARPLEQGRTYTLFVGQGARDRHGNTMDAGAAVVFTTGDTLPPGMLEGKVDARGFAPQGSYLWCYDVAKHAGPDSTGRDFDAVSLVDVDAHFRVPALPVPGRYRVWVFVDQNQNRSYEPDRDLLAGIDTTIALTARDPVARDLVFRVVNPRAPALVKGTVLDSLREREGILWVMATADSDTTRRSLATVNDRGQWEMRLDPGSWTIRAFRDIDRNRDWDPREEPASDARPIRAEPAGAVEGIDLVLRPAPGGARSP